MPSDSQSASTDPARRNPRSRIAVAGDGHRDALHLEARLDDVSERKRGLQALAVTLLGLAPCRRGSTRSRRGSGSAKCSVRGSSPARSSSSREIVSARSTSPSATSTWQTPTSARVSPGRVAELAAELEALLERRQRAGVVAGVVDEGPAERVEGRGELVPVAELAPEPDPLLELRSPALDVSVSGGERAQPR